MPQASVLTKKFAVPLLLVALSACSWVQLTGDGENVRVLDSEPPGACKPLGKTTVSGIAKVLGIARDTQTVAKELRDMARNSAAELNGDSILATTEIQDGKQTFAVYKCMP